MADRFCKYSIEMLAAVVAFGIGPAAAQDFTAGKTPAQLFQTDCTACHKSTSGLAKGRDTRALTNFLREHYTTKEESAAALAGYLGAGRAEGRPKPQAGAAAAGTAPNPAAKPKPVQRSEREAGPNAIANAPLEERPVARAPAAGHDAAKFETEETMRKLNNYAAAGGAAHDTERSAGTASKLESYAGAGSPADTLIPADDAQSKAEKKKKKSATSASASPSQSPAPAAHPLAPHRPPSIVIQRPAVNN